MKKILRLLAILSTLMLIVSFSIFCTIEINPETIREILGALTEFEDSLQDASQQEELQEPPVQDLEEEMDADQIDFEGFEGEPMGPEEGWVDFETFVKLVDSARWSGVSPGCYEGTSLTTYDYEGTETVNGILADKTTGSFSINSEDTTYWTIWVAEDGTIIKVEIGGEEAEQSYYEFYKLMAVPPLAPFALPDPDFNREFKRTLAGQNVPGWELLSFERKADRVGGKDAYVCDVSFIHDSYGSQTANFTYGDFGAFKILLKTYLAYASQTMVTDSISFR